MASVVGPGDNASASDVRNELVGRDLSDAAASSNEKLPPSASANARTRSLPSGRDLRVSVSLGFFGDGIASLLFAPGEMEPKSGTPDYPAKLGSLPARRHQTECVTNGATSGFPKR